MNTLIMKMSNMLTSKTLPNLKKNLNKRHKKKSTLPSKFNALLQNATLKFKIKFIKQLTNSLMEQ